MTIIREAAVKARPEFACLGIRVRTPMKGMLTYSDKLRRELERWLKVKKVKAAGSSFLRLYVIDMAGEMDIEVGVPVETAVQGDDRVKPSVLPAGNYASLVYQGHGLLGNKALLDWIDERGLVKDRWDDPRGDAFACRYEAFLTDRSLQPKKMQWDIEIAIKLK